MTFPEALAAAFKDGDRVTRTNWRNRANYFFVHEARLCTTWNSDQQRVDGLPHPVIITESDFFADDWIIVTDA